MSLTDRVNELLAAYPKDANIFRDTTLKSDGGKRELAKPNRSLGLWLKNMNGLLTKNYADWPDYIHGGRKGRSYVTYARPHVDQAMVITIDIRECFPSVSLEMIARALGAHMGLPELESARLAEKLSYRGRLAQGFSTSNFICNLVLLDVLHILNLVLADTGINLTNYVDDLALSGKIERPDEIINMVAKELSRAGLKVKKAKIKVMPASTQQIICGLLVNSKAKKQSLLRGVLSGALRDESAKGWIAHTKSIDKKFSEQLSKALAVRVKIQE
jgi:hypothetical protein